MKKTNIVIIALALILTATAAFGQTYQAVKAEIPFSFDVRGKTYPAGEYTIKRAGDLMHLWLIEGSDQDISVKVLMSKTVENAKKNQLKMTFRRYSDIYFLAGFTTTSYQVDLLKSKGERRLQRELKLEDKIAEVEIVTINAEAD